MLKGKILRVYPVCVFLMMINLFLINDSWKFNISFNPYGCFKHGPPPIVTDGFESKNLLKEGPFKFLPDFKNPCFYDNESRLIKSLRCLPYFFIAGFPKCGSTDLWKRLSYHPEIVTLHPKESSFFDGRRFHLDHAWTFEDFIDTFQKDAEVIRKNSTYNKSETLLFHKLITGEASVNTAAMNDLWYKLPENSGLKEPRYTNANYLRHLIPQVRLIFIMRDPTERLWSEYVYSARANCFQASSEDFHELMLESISRFQNCLQNYSEKSCVYNFTIDTFKGRLRTGLYVMHIMDWLRVFPRDQVLFIRTEEYEIDIPYTLKRIFKFLDIGSPPDDIFKQMVECERQNVQTFKGNISTKTKILLDNFYKPYNYRLSNLLGEYSMQKNN
ncbi:hypothetical protein CHS0354_011864 [Potamilus streckersoni]|uniref:Sulfotransferase domain-containing protein n=1 Tax=Potamilus streckersoni TaxID=2493646 RepID=A0AAE0TAW9_9BIVA|nr:hypothetical protein CHS0354_011864 [Potamilus streckersoni]